MSKLDNLLQNGTATMEDVKQLIRELMLETLEEYQDDWSVADYSRTLRHKVDEL